MSKGPEPSSKQALENIKQEPPGRSSSVQDIGPSSKSEDHLPWWKILSLILLMPMCSTAIHLPLTPSHGSIPAMEYHHLMFQTCLVLYFAWRVLYTGPSPVSFATRTAFIPVLATWVPFVQLYLTPMARYLGPAYNAVLIKVVTLVPLHGLLLSVIRTSFERSIPRYEFLVGLGALALYFSVEYAWSSYQYLILGVFHGLIRPYLMLLVSTMFMALLPSRWMIWALIPALHTLFWNPHSTMLWPARRLDSLLKPQGFSVLARREGLTGYISVLENAQDGYRLMRCDHSILGGNWIAGLGSWPGGRNPAMAVGRIAEPVYAVFVMLEAVRLARDEDSEDNSGIPDSKAIALNIGLGIGTTPSALIAHGINTTIVELDPIVHQLAVEHFSLPPNHTAVIEDAVAFVSRETKQPQPKQYDYIIHDVFTGGAEPTALFTHEFISGLRQLLNPGGTVAINYASDLDLPSTKLVINTIISVFPNCRLFRDMAEEDGSKHINFVNMVMFCRKTVTPFMFRQPVYNDYLETSSRKAYLLPKLEIDLERFVVRNSEGNLTANETMILHADKTTELDKWHGLAAARHWEVMRTVLPAQVWELW